MKFAPKNNAVPSRETALPGRNTPMRITSRHFVNDRPILPPFPERMQRTLFGMGCFWGAERQFWQTQGVFTTAVGYSGGYTPNPTYEEVCTGLTGHSEVVLVVFDPEIVSYAELLKLFWESHDPTQGMRQGNDRGTQYRSGLYTYDDEQMHQALQSRRRYQRALSATGKGRITTEIAAASEFYYAEEYHQQYLGKNPRGYCGLGGTGVACPSG